jgi:hypothetical protein
VKNQSRNRPSVRGHDTPSHYQNLARLAWDTPRTPPTAAVTRANSAKIVSHPDIVVGSDLQAFVTAPRERITHYGSTRRRPGGYLEARLTRPPLGDCSRIAAMAGVNFLGTDMTDPEVVPYFTWDDPLTVRDIQRRLRSAPGAWSIARSTGIGPWACRRAKQSRHLAADNR